MIISAFITLIESYKTFIIQPSKDWFTPFRILFMAISIFVYAFASLVVLTVLLIVILIALPISTFSKIMISKSSNGR
jgi:hypothetical protein